MLKFLTTFKVLNSNDISKILHSRKTKCNTYPKWRTLLHFTVLCISPLFPSSPSAPQLQLNIRDLSDLMALSCIGFYKQP